MNERIYKIIYTISILCAMPLGLFACSTGHKDSQLKPSLGLSVQYAPEVEQATILQDKSADRKISRVFLRPGLSNAVMEVDDTSYSLDIALQENIISEEDIILMVRKDAKNGFCTEEYESIHGITHFTYRYSNFNLRIIYDIYETPTNQQYLISDICIYPSNENLGTYTDFYDSLTGNRIDWEDWGITLDISDVSPTGLTLHCSQSGGQQIGQLQISWYDLSNQDGFLPQLDDNSESPTLTFSLKMNGNSTLTIDWTEAYGALPSGDYQLLVHILDIFDETSVHPLMDDFHDWQAFSVDFTIS